MATSSRTLIIVTVLGLAPTGYARAGQTPQNQKKQQNTYSYQQQRFATDAAGKTQAGSNNRWELLKQRWKERFKRWQLKKQYTPSVTRTAGKHRVQPTRFLWHMRTRARRAIRAWAHPRSRHRQRFHSRVYKRFRSFWQKRLKRLRKAWLLRRNQRQRQATAEPGIRRHEHRRLQRWRERIRHMVARIKARRLEGRRFRIFTGPRQPKDGSKLQALWRSVRTLGMGRREAPPAHRTFAHRDQPQYLPLTQ